MDWDWTWDELATQNLWRREMAALFWAGYDQG